MFFGDAEYVQNLALTGVARVFFSEKLLDFSCFHGYIEIS